MANSESLIYFWKSEEAIDFYPFFPTSEHVAQLAGTLANRVDDQPSFIHELLRSLFVNQFNLVSIAINQIENFEIKGEVYREYKISGGGGGGVSIGGAIVGGLLAGGVGAIIGGRQKVNPITSNTITHDTRETLLRIKNDRNEQYTITFNVDAYEVFNEIIPEKEISVVRAVKSLGINEMQTHTQSETEKIIENSPNSIDEIRKYKALLDDGIITKDEFDAKKKQLLGL